MATNSEFHGPGGRRLQRHLVPTARQWLCIEEQEIGRTLRQLLSAQSERDRKRLYSSLTGVFDPGRLLKALEQRDRTAFRRFLGRFFRRSSREAEAWIHTTVCDLRAWQDRESWSVATQSENAVLFRTKGEPGAKTLVVGFTGRAHWLMLPTYKILQALGGQGYDLLLLRDPLDQYYQLGIPGFGETPSETADSLGKWAADQGYADTIAVGTSAGHLMALYTTLHNRWRHAMFVGGTDPSECPVFDALLARTEHDPAITLHHCFPADNSKNARAAKALGALYKETRLFPYPGTRQHNLLEAIDKRSDAVAYVRLHLCTPWAAIPGSAL